MAKGSISLVKSRWPVVRGADVVVFTSLVTALLAP
jgi:hypothetical protein